MGRLRMASSPPVPAGQRRPVKVPGQRTREDGLDSLLRLPYLTPVREWGRPGEPQADTAGGAGRARCVPDRSVNAGNSQLLPDSPIYRLTCMKGRLTRCANRPSKEGSRRDRTRWLLLRERHDRSPARHPGESGEARTATAWHHCADRQPVVPLRRFWRAGDTGLTTVGAAAESTYCKGGRSEERHFYLRISRSPSEVARGGVCFGCTATGLTEEGRQP